VYTRHLTRDDVRNAANPDAAIRLAVEREKAQLQEYINNFPPMKLEGTNYHYYVQLAPHWRKYYSKYAHLSVCMILKPYPEVSREGAKAAVDAREYMSWLHDTFVYRVYSVATDAFRYNRDAKEIKRVMNARIDEVLGDYVIDNQNSRNIQVHNYQGHEVSCTILGVKPDRKVVLGKAKFAKIQVYYVPERRQFITLSALYCEKAQEQGMANFFDGLRIESN
jgi:hypothetical protein